MGFFLCLCSSHYFVLFNEQKALVSLMLMWLINTSLSSSSGLQPILKRRPLFTKAPPSVLINPSLLLKYQGRLWKWNPGVTRLLCRICFLLGRFLFWHSCGYLHSLGTADFGMNGVQRRETMCDFYSCGVLHLHSGMFHSIIFTQHYQQPRLIKLIIMWSIRWLEKVLYSSYLIFNSKPSLLGFFSL